MKLFSIYFYYPPNMFILYTPQPLSPLCLLSPHFTSLTLNADAISTRVTCSSSTITPPKSTSSSQPNYSSLWTLARSPPFLSLKAAMLDNNNNNNKLIRWESLPYEIATDIFLRLPIKSIIICTSVSKAWKSQIQNPTFISTHLHHSHNKNKNLLVFNLYSQTHKESYALHNKDDPNFTQLARFDYPFYVPFL